MNMITTTQSTQGTAFIRHRLHTYRDGFRCIYEAKRARLVRHGSFPYPQILLRLGIRLGAREDINMFCFAHLRLLEDTLFLCDSLHLHPMDETEFDHPLRLVLTILLLQLSEIMVEGRIDMSTVSATSYINLSWVAYRL